MAQEPTDLKLFSQVKDFLSPKDKPKEFPKKLNAGGFTYFNFAGPPKNQFDEVYPKIILGDAKIALQGKRLFALGVTHVVNASMGTKFNQTDTNQEFYDEYNITFHGIPALDVITFKLLPFLRPAADFIDEALGKEGMVYVHCQQGVSRSATVVLAFLMLKRDMDLLSAMKEIREKRLVFPNDGFLKQLCQLQTDINANKPTQS